MIEINNNLKNNIDNLFDDFDKLNNTNNFDILNKYNNIQQTLLNTYPNEIYTMLPYFSEHSFFSENECDHINKIGYSQKLEYQKTVLNTVDLSVFNCKINIGSSKYMNLQSH